MEGRYRLLNWLKWPLQVTRKNNKFSLIISIDDDNFSENITPPGAYELEPLNDEIKRKNVKTVISQ